MADSQNSSRPSGGRNYTDAQAKRWLEFVAALEQSKVHERKGKDREEAIQILVEQFQGDGPIFPVAPPSKPRPKAELDALGQELAEQLKGSKSS